MRRQLFTENAGTAAYARAFLFGLEAGRTGSGATAVVQYDFSSLATFGSNVDSVLAVTDSAVEGTRIQPLRRGLYAVRCGVQVPAVGELAAGIGFGSIPANHAADPVPGAAFVFDSCLLEAVTSSNLSWSGTAIIPVTLTGLGAPPVFVGLATDAAGAAPAAGDVVPGGFFIDVTYLGPFDGGE